jgi:type II secretory pathway predicted ATPase ExeA
VRVIQDHFEADATTDGMRPLLIIDEGHELKPDVLAMLRILTNFEMDSRLILSLILAGQPPLEGLLTRGDQAAMLSRLAHIDTLRLLSRDELAQYVEHRCAVAGAATTPFDTGALDAIFELSHGNMRATDRLALKALQTASRAGQDVVNNAHIVSARKYLWI